MFRTMKAVKRIYITESGFPAGSSGFNYYSWLVFRQKVFVRQDASVLCEQKSHLMNGARSDKIRSSMIYKFVNSNLHES